MSLKDQLKKAAQAEETTEKVIEKPVVKSAEVPKKKEERTPVVRILNTARREKLPNFLDGIDRNL